MGILHFLRGYAAEAGVCLVVLVGAQLVGGGFRPWVRFVSERITITVDAHYLQIEGFYTYYNPFPWPVTQGLSCPTPTGDGLSGADVITAERLPVHPGEPHVLLPLRLFGTRPYWDITIPGHRTQTLRVIYRQAHHRGIGRYLLTTTAPWGLPLRRGRYELHLLSGYLTGSNYPLRTVDNRIGVYFFERNDFLPSRDWVFRWGHGVPQA